MNVEDILNNKHRTEWEAVLWEYVCGYLAKAKSEKTFERAFSKLLSADEKKAITKRVAILSLIRSGKNYAEIGELLWVSPVTIRIIKKNFWDQSRHYKSRRAFPPRQGKRNIRHVSEIRRKKSFWDALPLDMDLCDLIRNPPRPVGMGLKKHLQK